MKKKNLQRNTYMFYSNIFAIWGMATLLLKYARVRCFCCKQPEMNIWTENRNAGCYWLIQKQRYFWRNWWYVTKNEVFFINDNWILIWYNQIKLYCVFWIIIVIDFSRLFSWIRVRCSPMFTVSLSSVTLDFK